MDQETIRRTLRLCGGALAYGAGEWAGIKHAELRMRPSAAGGMGIRLEYEDRTVLWLVVVECAP
jgi:hypothetical protein